MKWPHDADGDVFRSLEENGFDFTREYRIDVNLDFDHWPLSGEALREIKTLYPGVEVIQPEPGEDIGNGKDIGFLQFQVKAKLDYNHIVTLQREISENIEKFGGWCSSWGVGQW